VHILPEREVASGDHQSGIVARSELHTITTPTPRDSRDPYIMDCEYAETAEMPFRPARQVQMLKAIRSPVGTLGDLMDIL